MDAADEEHMGSDYNSDNAVQRVREAARIEEVIGECVSLKRVGPRLKGLCPFHGEKTPSFMVSPDRQTFHCFGCGEGGDVFSFVMKYHRLSFPEALQEMARRYHVSLPERRYSPAEQAAAEKRQAVYGANEKACALYHDFLLTDPRAAEARQYLEKRGIGRQVIEAYRLGFAPESWDFLVQHLARQRVTPEAAAGAGLIVAKERGGHYDRFRSRLLCPITDLTGKVVGFSGRITGDGQPKYLNTPESPVFDKSRCLFGLFQNRQAIRQARRCLVVEGNFDLLSLVQHGVENVVAPLGTALTLSHIRTLKGYADETILLFDGDAAGLKAALRAVPLFLGEQAEARVAILPAEHDPDTFIRQHGRKGLERHLERAMPLPEFVLARLVAEHGLTVTGKARILEEMRPVFETLGSDTLKRSVLLAQLAETLQLDAEQVARGFRESSGGSPRRPPATSEKAPAAGADTLPRHQRQILEFLILAPEYLHRFLEAGVEEVLTAPFAGGLLEHMRQLAEDGAEDGPERLLEELTGEAERRFVSGVLMQAADHIEGEGDGTMLEAVAAEQLAWLRRSLLLREREELTRQIVEAQGQNDDELLLVLLRRKMDCDREIDGGGCS